MSDMVNHPSHYTQASVPLEPIDILRHAPFDLGCCLKYIIRAGHKGNELEDWKKAQKYCQWAFEGYLNNTPLYINFFKYYGLLLRKFDCFKESDVDNVYEFFETIKWNIEQNIVKLEGKR